MIVHTDERGLAHPCASTIVRPKRGGKTWRVAHKRSFQERWLLVRNGARIERSTEELIDGWERVE